MEDITDIVTGLTNKRIKELAYEIKGELEDFCAKHKCTGAAMNSFKVNFNGAGGGGAFEAGASGSFRGGFLTSVSIYSNEPSAYYLDQGNGGPNRKIVSHGYPRKSLHLEHIGEDVYAKSVRGYDGYHYVKDVADRHR